jgi:hypothetical protein
MTMTHPDDNVSKDELASMSPVPVKLTNPEALGGAGPRKRRVKQITFRTRNLTATSPIAHLCAYDETRLYILIQAGGNNVVLCTDISEAQDPANQVAGIPNPNGFVLTAGNTNPIPVPGCQPIWAVGNTYPSQVTWITVHESA